MHIFFSFFFLIVFTQFLLLQINFRFEICTIRFIIYVFKDLLERWSEINTISSSNFSRKFNTRSKDLKKRFEMLHSFVNMTSKPKLENNSVTNDLLIW